MDKTLLITRPKHGPTVHYLFHWSKEVIKLAEEKGMTVLDMEGERANRKEVESMLRKRKPSLVFLNGHGDDGAVAGHDDEILLQAGDNEDALVDKIVYALSCKSGKKLGPESIKKGAKGYIGYKDDFIFFTDPDKLSDPLNDKIAGLFLEASNQIMISLLKGHSIEDCHKRSITIFENNSKKIVNSEVGGESSLSDFLLWNAEHQVCLGKQGASF